MQHLSLWKSFSIWLLLLWCLNMKFQIWIVDLNIMKTCSLTISIQNINMKRVITAYLLYLIIVSYCIVWYMMTLYLIYCWTDNYCHNYLFSHCKTSFYIIFWKSVWETITVIGLPGTSTSFSTYKEKDNIEEISIFNSNYCLCITSFSDGFSRRC